MDDPIKAIVDALPPNGAALADEIEQHELNIEEQADSSGPDLTAIAAEAQAVLPLLDQAATSLGMSQ